MALGLCVLSSYSFRRAIPQGLAALHCTASGLQHFWAVLNTSRAIGPQHGLKMKCISTTLIQRVATSMVFLGPDDKKLKRKEARLWHSAHALVCAKASRSLAKQSATDPAAGALPCVFHQRTRRQGWHSHARLSVLFWWLKTIWLASPLFRKYCAVPKGGGGSRHKSTPKSRPFTKLALQHGLCAWQ